MKRVLKHLAIDLLTRLRGDRHGRVLLPVLSGPARGLWFRFDLKSRLEVGPFLGTYERKETVLAQQLCRTGWTVWDCGGYLGYYTNLFARLVGPRGHVVVFEPDPRNMERIQENVRLNGFSNVQFVAAAIGEPVGEADFVLSDNTNSHLAGAYVGSSREEYAKTEKRDGVIKVRCLSLDEASSTAGLPPPELIKLDLDGAESQALRFAQRLVRQSQPIIFLELHNPECDAAAWAFSRETGYLLISMDTGEILQTAESVRGSLLCLPPKALAAAEGGPVPDA